MQEYLLERLAEHAFRAMLYEVSVTPKPGLVDRSNCGAHSDMDYYTFIDSTVAVGGGIKKMIMLAGRQNIEIENLLQVIRPCGKETEQAMFAATNGINTQKGLIFLLGAVCSTCAWMLAKGTGLEHAAIRQHLQCMLSGICESELVQIREKKTAGERIFAQAGLKGVRGEAENGLPNVFETALPELQSMLAKGCDLETSALQSLMALMASVDDTTVINRCGLAGLKMMKENAIAYITHGGAADDTCFARLYELDRMFISQRLSPGGCSDLLAVTLFFHFIGTDELLL